MEVEQSTRKERTGREGRKGGRKWSVRKEDGEGRGRREGSLTALILLSTCRSIMLCSPLGTGQREASPTGPSRTAGEDERRSRRRRGRRAWWWKSSSFTPRGFAWGDNGYFKIQRGMPPTPSSFPCPSFSSASLAFVSSFSFPLLLPHRPALSPSRLTPSSPASLLLTLAVGSNMCGISVCASFPITSDK